MGYCSSYSEVQRFEANAAASVAPDILGTQAATSDRMFLFAADNVDHNIVTLDGKGTFHGMGMIAAATPGTSVTYTVLRRKVCELNLTNETQIPIKEYRYSKNIRSSIRFQPLPFVSNLEHRVDLLWEVSFRFHARTPNWQGMMHTLNRNRGHPGKSSVLFLPMIDMYPGDRTCILSTLEYICKLASQHSVSPIITFDQPLFWKASEIVTEVDDSSPVKEVVLLLGSFHTLMNLFGAIGTLMEGSGLKEILQTIYGDNAVVHMLTGKAVHRALRGHLLVDLCLANQVISKIIDSEPEFQCLIQELETLYCKAENGEIDVNDVLASQCMEKICHAVFFKTI